MIKYAVGVVKAVGFDLDQTLYQDSPEIQSRVRGEFYATIACCLNIPFEEAQARFEEGYAQTQSGGQTLKELGIADAREVLRDCLVKADISQVLQYDEKLVHLMTKITKDYFTFLITESRQADAEKKLQALGLSSEIFHYVAFWDTTNLRKDTGTIFPEILRLSGLRPEEHVYCGDRLKDDILPAKQAGLKTILVGKENREADLCITTIHKLEEYFYG